MEFTEEHLDGVKNPILTPKTVRLIGFEGSKVRCLDYLPGVEYLEELHFYHGKETLVLNSFKLYFPTDAVLIMLFSPSGNLYLQQRGKSKKWEPGELDLIGVGGTLNAIRDSDHFKHEDWEDAALREIKEETGIIETDLKEEKLKFLGDFHNKHISVYQKIYAYQLDIDFEELKNRLAAAEDDVEGWVEQDYRQTMDEYFGDEVEKYAGGAELRPFNFISDAEIKKKLDEYHKKLNYSNYSNF